MTSREILKESLPILYRDDTYIIKKKNEVFDTHGDSYRVETVLRVHVDENIRKYWGEVTLIDSRDLYAEEVDQPLNDKFRKIVENLLGHEVACIGIEIEE